MISRFQHNFFSLATLLVTLVFGAIELTTPWAAGAARFDMNTPLGLVCRFLATSPFDPSGRPDPMLAYQLYMTAACVLVGLFVWLQYRLIGQAGRYDRPSMLVIAQLLIGVFIDSVPLNLVVAAQLGAGLPLRRAASWLGLQIGIGMAVDLYLIATVVHASDAPAVFLSVSLERMVQVLAFGIGCMVKRERQTRIALAAANAELRATQSLLGDVVRSSERMRIARDLHDVVGHHLTALGLHLDLAQRQSEGKPAASLGVARSLAQDMLAEVRCLVGAERHELPPNLREALTTLCSGIVEPEIRLHVANDVQIESAAAAHALFCCVREAITNTVRHADATLLEIRLGRQDGNLVLTVADNGRGRRDSPEGNGLRGMRERVAQLGGTMAFAAGGAGFGIDIRVPCAGGAA